VGTLINNVVNGARATLQIFKNWKKQ